MSEVTLNYGKLRGKRNSLKSLFRTIFPVNTQKQSTHQCCQWFDSSVSSGFTNINPGPAEPRHTLPLQTVDPDQLGS